MSQVYNDNIKRPKQKENQLGNLRFLLEIQQRALGPGESTAGTTYLSLRIHPKNCWIFPLKAATTLLYFTQRRVQLEQLRLVVKVGVKAIC